MTGAGRGAKPPRDTKSSPARTRQKATEKAPPNRIFWHRWRITLHATTRRKISTTIFQPRRSASHAMARLRRISTRRRNAMRYRSKGGRKPLSTARPLEWRISLSENRCPLFRDMREPREAPHEPHRHRACSVAAAGIRRGRAEHAILQDAGGREEARRRGAQQLHGALPARRQVVVRRLRDGPQA